jgi:hypothetical protein
MDYLKTKKLNDEYINWLVFANPGMLHKGNIYSMDLAISNLPTDHPVLEIGSFCGLSTNLINYLLFKYRKFNKIFSCDKWIFEGAEKGGQLGVSGISHEQYRDFCKSSFMRNVEFFSAENKPYTIEAFSDDFFGLWKMQKSIYDIFGRNIKLGGEISFCYIDGNHSYECARKDFENADEYLDIGGYILFDDSSDSNSFGLTKLMKEIISKHRYELVIKNPNYLFKKLA